jgi:hypothetical protein
MTLGPRTPWLCSRIFVVSLLACQSSGTSTEWGAAMVTTEDEVPVSGDVIADAKRPDVPAVSLPIHEVPETTKGSPLAASAPHWCLPLAESNGLEVVRRIQDVGPYMSTEFEVEFAAGQVSLDRLGFIIDSDEVQVYTRRSSQYRFIGLFTYDRDVRRATASKMQLDRIGDGEGNWLEPNTCETDCTIELSDTEQGEVELVFRGQARIGRIVPTPVSLAHVEQAASIHRALALANEKRVGVEAKGPCEIRFYGAPVCRLGCLRIPRGCKGKVEVVVCITEKFDSAWTLDGDPASGRLVPCGEDDIAWAHGSSTKSQADISLYLDLDYGFRRGPLSYGRPLRPNLPQYPNP